MLGWFRKQGNGGPAGLKPTKGGQLLPVGDNCRDLGGYPLPATDWEEAEDNI